jgi:hypothetical protein
LDEEVSQLRVFPTSFLRESLDPDVRIPRTILN